MTDLIVDTIRHKTGTDMYGVPTWLSWELVGSHRIFDSINISSVTDVTIGETTVAFNNSFTNGNYCLGCYGKFDDANTANVPENGWKSAVGLLPLSSESHIYCGDRTNDFDLEWTSAQFVGDLA